MTKFYASALLLLAAAIVPASGLAQKYDLISLISTNGEEELEYEYDRQGHIVSEHFNFDYDYAGTNLFYYNAAGKLIKMEWYQEMTNNLGEIFERYTAKIDYKYNSKNQMVSQSVYNNDPVYPKEHEEDFDYTGLIEYEYDNLGRLSKSTTYFMEEGKELAGDKTYYYYQDTDRCDSIMSRAYLADFDLLVCDSFIEFYYDEQGRLHQKSCATYDPQNGSLAQWYGLVYEYDANGNLENHYRINSEGVKAWQYGFTYDNSIPASDCNFPIYDYDADTAEIYNLMTHRPETKISYLTSITGSLTKYDVSNFTYAISGSGGIAETIAAPRHSLLVMGCKEGKLVLSGAAEGECLHIIDMQGRTVATPSYFGSADLSALPHGTYMVKGVNGICKFVR